DLLGNQARSKSALLAPLQANGGPTLTHALLANSPAIDAGITNDVPATDQRGFPRPTPGSRGQPPRADIGAFEFQLNLPRLPNHIPDQVIAANTRLGPLAFTVEDDETPAGALVVIVSSSNTNLVQNERIEGGTQAQFIPDVITSETAPRVAVSGVKLNDGGNLVILTNRSPFRLSMEYSISGN